MKEIQLTQNYITLVDDDDYEYLSKYRWFPSKRPNGRIYAKSRFDFMHRAVMRKELVDSDIPNPYVDHINHNCLDNRKSNLRIVSNSRNQRNRQVEPKGVTFHKGTKKWLARISVDGVRHHLGYFNTREEAESAREQARRNLP